MTKLTLSSIKKKLLDLLPDVGARNNLRVFFLDRIFEDYLKFKRGLSKRFNSIFFLILYNNYAGHFIFVLFLTQGFALIVLNLSIMLFNLDTSALDNHITNNTNLGITSLKPQYLNVPTLFSFSTEGPFFKPNLPMSYYP